MKDQASAKVDEAKDKASELAGDAQQKGKSSIGFFLRMFYLKNLAGELKDQAAQKVDQAKDKASELAADAKEKGRITI